MIAHLEALKDRLAPFGYTTHLLWASQVTSQYLVLSSPSWDPGDELPICGTTDAIDTGVRVKAVTGTPEGVGIMLNRIRDLLSPDLAPTKVPMAGREVWVQWQRSEFIDIDRDVTITGTGRHPAVGVETYRLTSEPA